MLKVRLNLKKWINYFILINIELNIFSKHITFAYYYQKKIKKGVFLAINYELKITENKILLINFTVTIVRVN